MTTAGQYSIFAIWGKKNPDLAGAPVILGLAFQATLVFHAIDVSLFIYMAPKPTHLASVQAVLKGLQELLFDVETERLVGGVV